MWYFSNQFVFICLQFPVLSVFCISDGDSRLESNQKNSKNQSIHLFRLLGGGKEGASDCFHSNGFYLSRLVWMYFRYDPWNDTTSRTSSDTKSRDNKKKPPLNITQIFDLIALCDRKTISREGEYWDYLIIICKIRTRSEDNPLASGWYFSVEWMVLILHCVNFEGLHQTDQTLARKMTEQVGISFYWLETFLQIYYQLLKSSGKLIEEKIKV